jgi:hypothetical protein
VLGTWAIKEIYGVMSKDKGGETEKILKYVQQLIYFQKIINDFVKKEK